MGKKAHELKKDLKKKFLGFFWFAGFGVEGGKDRSFEWDVVFSFVFLGFPFLLAWDQDGGG